MPKRTNDFQSLIKTIYDHVTPTGGTVTESAAVWDVDAQKLREVDILVEYRVAGHDIKLAIECRDRKRKDTVEWIDGLIGKTKSLAVDKVVAVSRHGFAASALKKAKANLIDTLSLKKACDEDWARVPIKPGIVVMTDETLQLMGASCEIDGKFYTFSAECKIFHDGEEVGTLLNVASALFEIAMAPYVQQYIKDHFLEIFATKDDTHKNLYTECEYPMENFSIQSEDGDILEMTKIKLVAHGTRGAYEVEQSHYTFNNKVISRGTHSQPDGVLIDFITTQDPETNKVHVKWQKTQGET